MQVPHRLSWSAHASVRAGRCWSAVALAACWFIGCGAASEPPAQSPEPEAPAAESTSEIASTEVDSDDTVAAPHDDGAVEATSAQEASPPEPRDVRYRVTPQGLVVETEGVRFEPKATPVRVGAGWGVKVEVKASTLTAARSLLNPKRGPLAFAGSVKRGAEESFEDQREEEGELIVSPGKEQTFSRTWPDRGEKPLTRGQELSLQVGLWGLGESAETRRPLKKFFSLKMVAGTKTPQPVIQPPDVN